MKNNKHTEYTYMLADKYRTETNKTIININDTWNNIAKKNYTKYAKHVFINVFEKLFPLQINDFKVLARHSLRYKNVGEYIHSEQYETIKIPMIIKAYFQSYMVYKLYGIIWEDKVVEKIKNDYREELGEYPIFEQSEELDYEYWIDLLVYNTPQIIAYQIKSMKSSHINVKQEVAKMLNGVNRLNKTLDYPVTHAVLVLADKEIEIKIREVENE